MKNINKSKDFIFCPYTRCMRKYCNEYPEYFLDIQEQIGLCPKCYNELCDEELKGDDK